MASKENVNWFKNVGKSFQYGLSDVGKRVAPNATNLYETNSEFVSQKLDTLRKQGFKKGMGNPLKNNQQLLIGKEALSNAISDIKSGKIYNKERQQKMLEEDDGGFGDFDASGFDSFDFDDSEATASFAHNNDDEDSDSSTGDTKVAIKQMSTDLNDTLKSNDRTVKNSTNRLVQNNNVNTEAVITSFGRSLAPISNSLTEATASLTNIEDFQLNSVKKSLEETKAYQTQTIELLTAQNDHLKKISESMTRYDKGNEEKDKAKTKTQYEEVFGTGAFSMQGYGNAVKNNANDTLNSMGLGSIKDMWNETSQLKYLAANPLGFVINKTVEKVLPTVVQQTMKKVDESVSNFIPAMLMRLNREGADRGGFLGILSNIFGVRSSTTGKVNLGNFEKGPIPFDGETKKSITEVIPGYLRKMLAVMSKQDEISFDFNEGRWRKSKDLARQFKEDRENVMMSRSGFRQVYNDSIRLAERSVKLDNSQMADLEKGLKSTLLSYIEEGNGVNMSNMDEILRSMKDFENETVKRFAAQLLKDGMKDRHMNMMGAGIMKGRSAEKGFMSQAEENSLFSYASIAQNGLLEMGQSLKDSNEKTEEAVVKLGANIYGSDKFGLTTQDYVRDIRNILLNGIKVYTSGQLPANSANPNATIIAEKNRLNDEYEALVEQARNTDAKKRFSDEQKNLIRNEGGVLLSDLKDDISMQSIGSVIGLERSKMLNDRNKQEESIFAELKRRVASGDSAQRVFKERMDAMLAKPAAWVTDKFNKFDEWMYNVAFPDPNKQGSERSFIVAIGDKIKDTFTSVKDFAVDNIYKPLKDSLFGKDGVFTKMKGENGIITKTGNFFLGQREIHSDGTKGRRMGGAFSSLMDGMYDAVDMVKQQFTGKEYTDSNGVKHMEKDNAFVPSMMRMITGVKDGTKKYLLGDKDGVRDVDKKGFITTIFDSMKTGVGNWNKALFGGMGKDPDSIESKKTVGEAAKSMFNKAPKLALMAGGGALAGAMLASGTGLIGAVLLPSSIMTVLGGGLGLATQSERFMTKMFGEKDIKGDRIGGIVARSTQDFFKNNKNVIIGGGALGLAKALTGFGIGGALGGAVLGPIGMAGLGIAGAMAYRSDAMQNILFGKMDANTGERLGGLLNKSAKKDKKFKDLLPNMAIGGLGGGLAGGIATYGVLGSFFGPFGAAGGALLGLAGGIALSSTKFNKFLFGTWDEKTGLRDGGVIGRFGNWFEHSIKNPMYVEFQQVKLNIKKWFTRSITDPFKQAIDPMKKAFTNMISKVNDTFTKSWEVIRTSVTNIFQEKVGKPFGEFMNKYIMGPVKKIMKAVLYTPFKIGGAIASAPFKVGAKVGESLEKRHMKQGVEAYRQDVRDTKGISYFQKMKMMYFDRDAINRAKTSEDGADYADPELRAKRDAERAKRDAEYAKEQARIDAIKDKHGKASRLAAKYNYETFIDINDPSSPEGKRRINLSRLLNVNNDRRGKNFAEFMKNGSNKDEYKQGISEALGVPLQMLLGTELDEDIDPSKLTANQRKVISRAFKKSKGSIKGNELLRKMGIRGDVRKFEENRQAILSQREQEAILAKSKDELQIDGLKRISDVSVDNTNRIIEAIRTNNLNLNTNGKISNVGGLPDLNNMNQTVRLNNLQFFGAEKPTTEDGTESVDIVDKATALNGAQKGKTFKEIVVSNIIRIAKYTRSISMDTKNQLDGVGSNVYKLRKTVQMALEIDDADVTGSANKDRQGLWGRIRRGLMYPIERIGDFVREKVEIFTTVVKTTVDKFVIQPVKSVIKGIKAVANYTKDIVVGVVKGVGSIGKTLLIDLPKGLVSAVSKATISIAKGVGKVIAGAASMTGNILRAVGEVGLNIVESSAAIVKGFAKAVGSAIAGLGKGIGNILVGLGKGVGTVVKTIGDGIAFTLNSIAPAAKALVKGLGKAAVVAAELPFKIVEGLGKTFVAVTQTAAKFTVSAIKTIGDVAIDIKNGVVTVLKGVTQTVWSVIKAPFQFIGKGISSLMNMGKPQRVTVVGGYLDSIRGEVKSTEKDTNPIGGKFSPSVELKNLQFFGGNEEDNSTENLNSVSSNSNPNSAIKGSKLRGLFRMLRMVWTKKNPLPVTLVSIGKTKFDTEGGGSSQGGNGTGQSNPSSPQDDSSTSNGDIANASKAMYSGGKKAAGGVYGTAKGLMSAKNAEKGERVDAFKNSYKSGYGRLNAKKEGSTSNAVTGVGSGVVATPGKLTKARGKLSNNYKAGFSINRNADADGSFVSRKDIGHLQAEAAQAQEMEEQAIFRFSVVDLLSKIEWNTRMTYEAFNDLNKMLPKLFKDLGKTLMGGLGKLGDKLDEVLKGVADKDDLSKLLDDDNDDDDSFDPDSGPGGDVDQGTKMIAGTPKGLLGAKQGALVGKPTTMVGTMPGRPRVSGGYQQMLPTAIAAAPLGKPKATAAVGIPSSTKQTPTSHRLNAPTAMPVAAGLAAPKAAPVSSRLTGPTPLLLGAPAGYTGPFPGNSTETHQGTVVGGTGSDDSNKKTRFGRNKHQHTMSESYSLGQAKYNQQNATWEGLHNGRYVDTGDPDYERYGYKAYDRNGNLINADGSITAKGDKIRTRSRLNPITGAGSVVKGVGKGMGKLLKGGLLGAGGIAGIIGVSYLASSLMNKGLAGTWEDIKDKSAQGVDYAKNLYETKVPEKYRNKVDELKEKYLPKVEEKYNDARNYISDKVSKAKTKWEIAKNYDGKEGMSFEDILGFISGEDKDGQANLVNSKLGQGMLSGYKKTKDFILNLDEDFKNNEGIFTYLDEVQDVFGKIKGHFKNQAEGFSEIWSGMKNLDIGQVMEGVMGTDLKYVMGGLAGLAAFKTARGIRNHQKAKQLRNQDMAAEDRDRNARGLDTRSHMRSLTKRRTMKQRMSDFRRNDFGMSREGRANAREEQRNRRTTARQARRDLRGYDRAMSEGGDTEIYDSRYADTGMRDHNGYAREGFRGNAVVRNGRIVGYDIDRNADMSADSLRQYGSRMGNHRFDGSRVQVANNAQFDSGSRLSRMMATARNPIEAMRHRQNQEDALVHLGAQRGERVQRRRGVGGALSAGAGALTFGLGSIIGAPLTMGAGALGAGGAYMGTRNDNGQIRGAAAFNGARNMYNNRAYNNQFFDDRDDVFGRSNRSFYERSTRQPDPFDANFARWSHMNSEMSQHPNAQNMNYDEFQRARRREYEYGGAFGGLDNPYNRSREEEDRMIRNIQRNEALGKESRNLFTRMKNSVAWETARDFRRGENEGGWLKTYNRNKNTRLEEAGLNREERFSTRMKGKITNTAPVKAFRKWKDNRNNVGIVNKGFLGYWGDEVRNNRNAKREARAAEAREAIRNRQIYSQPIGPDMPGNMSSRQRVSNDFDNFNTRYSQQPMDNYYGGNQQHQYGTSPQQTAGGQTRSGRNVGRRGGKLGAIGNVAGKVGGFMKGTGGKILGGLGRNALKLGGAALGGVGLAAGAAMGAKRGVDNVEDIFDIKQSKDPRAMKIEATAEQKKAAGVAGGIVGAIPFADMLDEALGGKMTKWIANVSLDAMSAFDKIKGKLKDGWEKVKEAVSNPMKTIGSLTSKAWKGIKSLASKGWNKVKSLVSKPISSIKKSTSKAWNKVKSVVSKAWDKVKSSVMKPINKVKSATSKAWNKVKEVVSKAWTKVKSSVTKPINKIKSSTSKAWSKVKDVVSKAWTKVKSLVTKPINKIKSATSKAWDKIKETVTKIWTNVKEKITSVVKSVYTNTKEKFESAKKAVVDKFTLVKTTITDKVKAIYETAKDKFEAAKKAVVDKFKSIVSTVTDNATGIYNAIVEPIQGVASTISSKLSGIKSSVSSFLDGINPFGSGYGSGQNKSAKRYGAGPNVYRERLYNNGQFGAGELDNDGAYYSQNDARWSGQSLTGAGNSASFGDAGCGPTAASMLVSSVKSSTGAGVPLPQEGQSFGAGNFGAGYGRGDEQQAQTVGSAAQAMDKITGNTPKDALKYAQRGGFVDGQKGTRDDFFASYASSKNVQMRQKENPDADFVKSQLAAGNKMILRGEGGLNFTNAGHYIVATGIDKSGKVKIKDPISTSRSGMYDINSVVKNATDAYVAGNKIPKEQPIQKVMYSSGDMKDIAERTQYGMDLLNKKNDGDYELDEDIQSEDYYDGDASKHISSETNIINDFILSGVTASGYGMGKKWAATAYDFIKKADSYKGTKYVWGGGHGGKGPDYGITGGAHCVDGRVKKGFRGLDCSGLVSVAHNKTTSSKYHIVNNSGGFFSASYTVPVRSSDIREGDLVFFGSGGITHIGIITGSHSGGFKMTHSPSGARCGTNTYSRTVTVGEVVTTGNYYGGRLQGFARFRHIEPGKKIKGGWKGKNPRNGYAKAETYTGDGADNGTTKSKSKDKKTNKSTTTTTGTKTVTKKTLITDNPFEQLNLIMTKASTSLLAGKKLSTATLKNSLYNIEKVTKYVGKTASSASSKSKKKTDKASSSGFIKGTKTLNPKSTKAIAKLSDTVATVGIKSKYKPVGYYSGNGKSASYFYDKDVRLMDSTVTAADINKLIKSKQYGKINKLTNRGQDIIDSAANAGIDPRQITAQASLESGWGTSNILRNKNNFFGYGAADNATHKAWTFSSPRNGIIEVPELISKNYPNGKYKRKTLRGFTGLYASDRNYHVSNANIMKQIKGTGKFLKSGSGFGKFGAGETKATIKHQPDNRIQVKIPTGADRPKVKVNYLSTPKTSYASGEMRRHAQSFAKGDAIENGSTLNTIYSTNVSESSSSDDMLSTLKEIAQNTRDTVTAVEAIMLPDASGQLVVAPQIGVNNQQQRKTTSQAQKNATLIAAGRK